MFKKSHFLFDLTQNRIIISAVPYANPKKQPKNDLDHTINHTSTPYLTTMPDFKTISRSINQTKPFSDRNVSDAADATAAAAAATPSHIYSNSNIQSNSNSLFIPASTSKYPIRQNTIAGDFRERVINFVAHWIRAFVYLARK